MRSCFELDEKQIERAAGRTQAASVTSLQHEQKLENIISLIQLVLILLFFWTLLCSYIELCSLTTKKNIVYKNGILRVIRASLVKTQTIP